MRFHAAAALVLCAAYAVSSFAVADGVSLGGLLLSEGIVAWASEEAASGLRRWIMSIRPVAPVAFTVVIINALLGAGSGVAMALRLFAASGAFSLLQAIADQDELLFLVSNPFSKFSLAMALTLRLAPYLRRRVSAVCDVQVSRGAIEAGGTLAERLKARSPVLRAAVYESLELSLNLAEAMFSRGWGAGPRSRYPGPPFRARDLIICIAAVCGSVGFIVAGWRAGMEALAVVAVLIPPAVYVAVQRWSHVCRKG